MIREEMEKTSDVFSSLSDEGMSNDGTEFLSDEYFNEIDRLFDQVQEENNKKWLPDKSNELAARAVLEKMMDDLGSNRNALKREHDNFERFFETFDENVGELDRLKDGKATKYSITKRIHYFRNILNTYSGAPVKLDDMIELAAKDEWKLFMNKGTAYHRYNYGNIDGALNVKFLSADGRFEAVYNVGTGKMVTDPANMGT
jgi:hypothetical protein